jgi:hypothetical protein
MVLQTVKLGTSATGDVDLDVSRLVDTRLLVQANSGGGKSWCLRRILEQTHGRLQHLVIDPEGEFSSLREKFDYVLAAKSGGDTVADPRSAGLLAERLLELGASAILDIYELQAHERIRFVRLFLEAIVDAPKKLWHPALVVIDEAHVYCPEKGNAESADAVKDLATRGRKRGFCALLATQRLAKLAKDAAAECNNKIIGRTGLDVDMDRAGEELGFPKARRLELRELAEGHFFAFGPAISRQVVSVHIGGVQTTHPKAGARLAFTAPPPTEKVKALLPKLADLPAEAEHRVKTVEDLRREVQSLQARLRAAERATPAPVAPKVVERAVITEAQIKRLEAAASNIEKAWDVAGLHMTRTAEVCINKARDARPLLIEIKAALATARDTQRGAAGRILAADGRSRAAAPHSAGHPPLGSPRPAPAAPRRSEGGVSPVEQRVLNALAELEVIGVQRPERVQVAFLSGYGNMGSKGFKNATGSLNTAGLITYPGPGTIELTPAGREVAVFPVQPRSAREVQDRVIRILGGQYARVLEPLIEAYPQPMDRDELGRMAGYTNTGSKGFKNAMGRLRSLGFVDYPTAGQVKAQPVLFLEGAA